MSKAIIKNPIIFSDIPDVDVLRVGNAYYMVSTTMHVMPGCPIMKSTDLANWQIQSYIYDKIEDNDQYELKNGKHTYGRGQWATSLRYNNGVFYAVFVCNDMKKTYIYHTTDIESGEWKRDELDGIYHDPSLLFDDDGKLYIFYNCGDVRITELKPDASGLQEGGINQLLFSTPREGIGLRCEGCHAYKINGYYYLIFIEWPVVGNKRRREICYRSKNLLGPYERKVIMDDDMGYHNKGVAQGAIFDTPDGEWFAMLFQDHDAVGRIPCILPVKWEDDWPMLGIDGKVPESFEGPHEESGKYDIVISDDFNHVENKLALNWQWNHNPIPKAWSFTERPGYLRLTTAQMATNILDARGTLTQRTVGPKCAFETHLETAGMKIGDKAGFVALQSTYGTVGISMETDGAYVIMTTKGDEVREKIRWEASDIYLKVYFDFEDSRDIVEFYYSANGSDWKKIGVDVKMLYTLDHFMGYRIGLYNYATKELGGYADYEYFKFYQF
ncbi:MAG: glycosyl hydrolase 43 family protein [Lachnospiraceae bacterium]|nr:glycosyl hydrolase 43 family protein [Lachnospiraceae bacterium]